MSGRFFGRTYHVIGRAQLGVMDGGKIYYWTEYYLQADPNEIATLVYERTGMRGEWRWFTQFNPEAPLTAGDAAIKRQGDYVTIDDNTAEILLARESRVYHVEGQAPEGVRAGAHANYFNARDGAKLFVVSWTGEEVEFYQGMNLARGTVAFAFKLGTAQLAPDENKTLLIWTMVGIMALVILTVIVSNLSTPSRQSAITPTSLSAPKLNPGATGTLRGTHYRIETHSKVYVAEVGSMVVRHEYLLRDDEGNDALLVYGWSGGRKDWLLFTSLHPDKAPSPREAGGMKLGERLVVGELDATVSELFRSTVLESDNTNEQRTPADNVRYGLVGKAGTNYLLARWNEQQIAFSGGEIVSEREVTAAFDPGAGKQTIAIH